MKLTGPLTLFQKSQSVLPLQKCPTTVFTYCSKSQRQAPCGSVVIDQPHRSYWACWLNPYQSRICHLRKTWQACEAGDPTISIYMRPAYGDYAVLLLWYASHFGRSTKLPHVAHRKRIASPERALLELWLQIRNVPRPSKCRGMSRHDQNASPVGQN
jgi:hypothetical protein